MNKNARARETTSTPPSLQRRGWPLRVAPEHLEGLLEYLARLEVDDQAEQLLLAEHLAERARGGALPTAGRPRRLLERDSAGLFTAPNGREYVEVPR